MKKILCLAVVLVLGASMLTACGGDNANVTPTNTNSDTAAYEKSMSEYITAFEELISGSLGPLMQNANSLTSEEEIVAWCQSFMTIKDAVGKSADSLADAMKNAPEEFKESHAKITVATAAVYDAMTGFEKSVDAAINGEENAFNDGIAEFVGNMQAADKLWDEAVEK